MKNLNVQIVMITATVTNEKNKQPLRLYGDRSSTRQKINLRTSSGKEKSERLFIQQMRLNP